MKSPATSTPSASVVLPCSIVRIHSGPAPAMNSALSESLQGFLNRTSVSHSVESRLKRGVTPASISSQFSIGVTSAATSGPKLAPPPVRLWLAAAPSSTIAAGSLSTDCAKAFRVQRIRNTTKAYFVAFTMKKGTLITLLRQVPRDRILGVWLRTDVLARVKKRKGEPGSSPCASLCFCIAVSTREAECAHRNQR